MKRVLRYLALPVLALAGGLAGNSATAAYVFTTIDFPGAQQVQTFGINNAGQIAVATDIGAFVYQGGAFVALPPGPAGWDISPVGMNDAGDVVGYATNATGDQQQGFLLRDGSYRLFAHPGGRPFTGGRAVGSTGLITGHASNADWFTQPSSVGFIYDPATGAFTDIVPPDNVGLIIAQGTNAAGQVVGSYSQGTPFLTAFLRQPDGTLQTFRVDGLQTAARGINDNGLIVGWVFLPSGQSAAFVGNSSGFELLQCPATVCPGVVDTAGQGINNDGQIVGGWEDAAGVLHGFIATPAALPTGTTAGGAYTFDVAVVPNQTIFIDPAVAIGFDYEIGIGNPKFASVRLPIGIGDNRYTLIVHGHAFAVAAGEQFDFAAHGFTRGVAQFRVVDIEASAGLDPANSAAFPTGLTFASAGNFTGTMTPLCRDKPLPAFAGAGRGRGLSPCGAQ